MYYNLAMTIGFYGLAFLVIFVLTKISPNAHDGGLGVGGIALLMLPLLSLTLVGLNIYWGIRLEYYYFIIAGIHFVVLFLLITRLFL